MITILLSLSIVKLIKLLDVESFRSFQSFTCSSDASGVSFGDYDFSLFWNPEFESSIRITGSLFRII